MIACVYKNTLKISLYCEVLEAIFLHGLKETFLGRLSSRLGSEFSPRMPEPSFWTFALVFSHKQVILPEPQSYMTSVCFTR